MLKSWLMACVCGRFSGVGGTIAPDRAKIENRGFVCVLEIISILLIFSFLTAQNVTELLQWLRMAVIPCFGVGTMT